MSKDDLLDDSTRTRRKRNIPQSSNVLYGGIASIIFAILSYWSFVIAIISIILGITRIQTYKERPEIYNTNSLTRVWIGIGLAIIGILTGLVLIALGIGSGGVIFPY